MPDGIRWVGLDVHAHESTIAIFDQGTGELMTRRVVGRPHELLPWLRGVARPAWMVYEAGPAGYGLARRLVCAPGRADRAPIDDRVRPRSRCGRPPVPMPPMGDHEVAVVSCVLTPASS
jgi:hypothetical protein